MKAAEYVRLAKATLANPPLRSKVYQGCPPEEDGPCDDADVALEVVRQLLNEVKPIADARNAHSDEAILAIMLELQQKWRAICNRMNHPVFVERVFMVVVRDYNKRLGDVIERGRL